MCHDSAGGRPSEVRTRWGQPAQVPVGRSAGMDGPAVPDLRRQDGGLRLALDPHLDWTCP